MAAGVVKCHIIVEGGIHASGAQSIGNRPQAEQWEGMGNRKAKERQSSHCHADRCDHSRPKPPRQSVALKAGYDGAGGDEQGDNSGVRDWDSKCSIHGWPRRAEQGIRQSEADKR